MTRFERAFVWAGGAVFVASLLVCTAWYLFVLGHSMPSGGWQPLAFDAVLFSVFALHHSVFAREPVKQRLAAIPARLQRSVYVWIASVLLIFVCVCWRTIGGELYRVAGARAVAHAGVQLAGLWLIARSVAQIDPLELAGIRSSTGTSSLQIGGPYRLVRHPVYLGWIVAVFGAAHMTGDRLAFAAISSFYLLIAVPWEERSLAQSFGEDYARYTRQVRWRVIPFVY
jgi:methanethiol S-methyltransferase